MAPSDAVNVRCRAKLNLTLDILGRRSDGYHDLATVMHAVDVADDIAVWPGEAGMRLVSTGIGSPPGPENIVYRAAARFCQVAGVGEAIEIRLHKRIPSEAGLAGGSADAAGVLVALAAMHGWSLGDERLASIARELGADVPFFLGDGAALAEGMGERLTPLPAADFHVVLALCTPGVSTPWAYGQVGPGHYSDGSRASRMALELLRRRCVSDVGNDFVPALAAERPDIAEMIARLARLTGGPAGMTGSGACCFAITQDAEPARRAAAELADAGIWTWTGTSTERPVEIATNGARGDHQ